MSGPYLSRRAFLRLALLSGIGLSLATLRWQAGSFDPMAFVRWTLRRSWRALSGARSTVAVAPCPSYEHDVLAALRGGWDDLGAPSLRGQRVVLKPNLVSYIPGPPGNTHATVVEAAIALCRLQGAADVVVAEGMAFVRDAAPILQQSGLATVLAATGARFVDLNYDDVVEVPLAGRYTALRTLSLPRTIVDADCVISLAKMKTHHWAGLSLSMKNLFGVVPGLRYGWPKNALHVAGLDLMILELLETIRPRWAIVDGVVGMEGDGPLYGSPVPSGALVMGQDLVAVDATCSRLMGMGLDATGFDHVQFAQAVGLGWAEPERIDVRGAAVASLARTYARAPGY